MEEQIQPQPQMPTAKHGGVVGIILTFIITALVVGGAVYYWQQTMLAQKVNDSVATAMQESNKEILDLRQQMEELRKEITSTETDEKDWDITLYKDLSIYTDSELGLSFSYPKDFSQTEESDLFGKLFKSDDGHFWLKISDNDKDLKTIQDLKDDIAANNSIGGGYQGGEFIKLEGLDVYKQWRYDLGVIENYYFLLNNKIVKFNFEFNFDAKDEDLQSKYKNLIASVVNSITYEVIYQNNLFDLSVVKVGDKIVGLTISSIEPFKESAGELSYDNAKVKFSGQKAITGTYHYNDILASDCIGDIEEVLPKIKEDTRSAWLCFTNKQLADQKLASYKDGDEISVLIKDYNINSYPAEVANTAELIDLE